VLWSVNFPSPVAIPSQNNTVVLQVNRNSRNAYVGGDNWPPNQFSPVTWFDSIEEDDNLALSSIGQASSTWLH
jgi:hypothetical protein